MTDELGAALFSGDGENVYAIIDGASCEELPAKLHELRPDFFCLYAGELAPDVAAVAPYLVELPPDHPFTEWLLTHCPGKPWCIFARSAADLRALRKHFRTFLLVKNADGKTIYFRYYDPRVLPIYLPTCKARELAAVFGPVNSYVLEEMKTSTIVTFYNDEGAARQERLAVTA